MVPGRTVEAGDAQADGEGDGLAVVDHLLCFHRLAQALGQGVGTGQIGVVFAVWIAQLIYSPIWLARFRELSATATMAGYRVGRTAALLAAAGYLITMLGSLAVVASSYLAGLYGVAVAAVFERQALFPVATVEQLGQVVDA